MVLFNYATRELTAKIVYYGPGLCGKTTNLQYIHQNLPETVKGKMLSLATKTDRTLFFDFLPIDLGEIRGMKTRVQLYTVPGQVFYNETRKLVLKGADGIVFVADSQDAMTAANVESFKNLEENLKAHGMTLAEMPHVIQFNKRDLPNLASIETMNSSINKYNAPFYESVATTGIGVQDTLKAVTKLVLLHLTQKYDPQAARAREAGDVAAAPAPAPAAKPRPKPAPPQPHVAAGAIPLSPAGQGGIPVAPPHAAGPPPAPESVPTFGEQEIDAFVGEVDEIEQTPAAIEPPAPAFDPPGEPGLDTVMVPSPLAATPAPAPAPELPGGSSLEIDMNFDPEFSGAAAGAEAVEPVSVMSPEPPPTPIPVQFPDEPPEPTIPDDGAAPADAEVVLTDAAEVVLTEAAEAEDLFQDPDVEVAEVPQGEAREIQIPVRLGQGPAARKFMLSVILRLDPLD